MSTTFVNLPTLAGNGSGAAVSVSGIDSLKTIVSAGNGGVFEPIVNVEISNDVAGTFWATIATFTAADETVRLIPARWMRATVQNYRGGGAPAVDVGGDVATVTFATLVATAGNGSGAAVDISALGTVKSVQVADAFRGTVVIEVSEDGTTEWGILQSFSAPGVQVATFTAHWMRVTRTGVPQVNPGLPVINVAAGSQGGGGGGGVTQVFDYTVTGAEVPSLSDFTVTLPAARTTTNYSVQTGMQGVAIIVEVDTPKTDFTLTTIHVISTLAFTVGDVITFTVQDLT